jgi:hypothetical protein
VQKKKLMTPLRLRLQKTKKLLLCTRLQDCKRASKAIHLPMSDLAPRTSRAKQKCQNWQNMFALMCLQ